MTSIDKQIRYYLKNKVYTILYLALFFLYFLLLNNIEADVFYIESLYYHKIMIFILIIFNFLFLKTVKLYEFSLFYTYKRKDLMLTNIKINIKYSIVSSLFMYFIINIVGFYKIEYYVFDINLLFNILIYFIILALINMIINLLFNSFIGIILSFFINLIFLFLSLFITDNIYFINIYYETYYYTIDIKYIIVYLISLFSIYISIFNFKELR